MILGWWSLSPQHSYSWYIFFLAPSYSSLGRGSSTGHKANLKRVLFGSCCALLGLPMALSQCHMGWVCPFCGGSSFNGNTLVPSQTQWTGRL